MLAVEVVGSTVVVVVLVVTQEELVVVAALPTQQTPLLHFSLDLIHQMDIQHLLQLYLDILQAQPRVALQVAE